MKFKSARTFMPEISAPGSGLSPVTDKVRGFPTGYTMEDAVNGVPYRLPDAGDSWGKGEGLFTSYKPEGADMVREDRDNSIFNNILLHNSNLSELWVVKIDGGEKEFPSLQSAYRYQKELESRGQKIKGISRIKTAQNNNSQTITDVYSKTFMVSVYNMAESYQSTGAAFCIENNTFATCAHVIKKYNKLANEKLNIGELNKNARIILTNGNEKVTAKILLINEKLDIAILQGESRSHPLPIKSTCNIGDEIFVIGSPHGFENNVTFGKVSSLNRLIYQYEGAPKYMFIDASVFGGNSGGPIVDQNSGEVIGIVTAIAAAKSEYGLNAGLPIFYLEKYCKDNKIDLFKAN